MKDAYNFFERHLKENDVIVIGVSGGPDSMALLNLAISFNKFKIICAHINHNVRKESYDEAIMVENFCNSHNVIFRKMVISEYSGGNFESEARDKRYSFYKSLMDEYGSGYLLTAHHGDDLMETMLMRMVRGSSLRGYSGFSEYEERNGYIILRPLIHNTKEEILNYVIDNKIPYAIDASNEDETYTRNRYRKYILPRLKDENSNVHEKFYDLSIMLKESSDFIKSEALKKMDECYVDGKLNLNYFDNYSIILKREILKIILNNIYKKEINLITNVHLNQILELNKANASLDFPKNIKIHKSYDYITFDTGKKILNFYEEIRDEVKLPNGRRLKVSTTVNDKSNDVICLSKEDVCLPLYVRFRKDGDKIILKGLEVHKKVKDILIDEKIPKKDRDLIPVVCDKNGEIVWLPGLKKSKFDKSNGEKCDIIVKYI